MEEKHYLALEEIEGFEGEDPGQAWHPAGKPLNDLTYEEVMDHLAKPERQEQPDAGLVLDHDGDDEGAL